VEKEDPEKENHRKKEREKKKKHSETKGQEKSWPTTHSGLEKRSRKKRAFTSRKDRGTRVGRGQKIPAAAKSGRIIGSNPARWGGKTN